MELFQEQMKFTNSLWTDVYMANRLQQQLPTTR